MAMAMQDTGLIVSILGALNFGPGMSSPKVPLLSDPKCKRPVFESPCKLVHFLFVQLIARKVCEYIIPSDISADLVGRLFDLRCPKMLAAGFF